MKRLFLCMSVLFLLSGFEQSVVAQDISPKWLSERWDASWSVSPDGPGKDPALFLFRRTLTLESAPKRFVIHVSADQHYRLFVNGVRASLGPEQSDLLHWRFETIDIAPFLKEGVNVLGAMVWSEGDLAPWPQISAHTAFVVQGDGEFESQVNTPGDWKIFRDRSWEPVSRVKREAHNCDAPNERIRGALHPWDWLSPGFDDSKWPQAVAFNLAAPAAQRGMGDSLWMLTPRNIPQLEETPDRMTKVLSAKRVKVPPEFIAGGAPVTVPPHTKATVMLDREKIVIGYPELTVSGGADARIRLSYEEALFKLPEVAYGKLIKGNRNVTKNKGIRDNYRFDEFYPDGGAKRVFSPLLWRTLRFVQMEIETGDSPVTVEDFRVIIAGYPLPTRASFDSSDPSLKKIWDTGWYTIRSSSLDEYVDGPFYEEFEYIGDTRVRSIVNYYVSGDDALTRNAIEQFFYSRLPDGLTQSRYPSRFVQVIPPFSLLWIGMLHDYWMFRGDAEYLRRFLPGIQSVLGWYEDKRLPEHGLLGNLPLWNFVDWAWADDGVPPGAVDARGSCVVTMQYVIGLRDAADIEEALGEKELAKKHRMTADVAAHASGEACWDEKRGIMADTPDMKSYSQHATALAVLSDAVPAYYYKPAMEKVMGSDPSIAQCSLYFRHYLHEAADKAGLSDNYLSFLKPWREALDLGLTTWPETPGECRSDHHAWSSTPTSDLLSFVCGVQPGAPGFASVRIAPHPGSLKWVRCEVPHPNGMIRVSLKEENGGETAEIELPPGTPGVFMWKEKTITLKPGRQIIDF